MRVLITQSSPILGQLWKRHLERLQAKVVLILPSFVSLLRMLCLSLTPHSFRTDRFSVTVQMPVLSCKRRPRPVTWPPLYTIMAALSPTVCRVPINHGIDWDDSVWIDAFVAIMIMPHDMIHVDRLCHAFPLI